MPQLAVPLEPPATDAVGKELSPTSIRTRPRSALSVSAAISASAVRAPVPMSDAAIRTVNVPSCSARAVAWPGLRRAG